VSVRRAIRKVSLLSLLCGTLMVVAGGCGADRPRLVHATQTPVARHDRFDYARGLFRQLCGGCHTLADAGTHGTRKDLEESGVATIVHTRSAKIGLARYAILVGEDGRGSGVAMPAWKGVLSDRQVEALSAYLGAVVGKGARHG